MTALTPAARNFAVYDANGTEPDAGELERPHVGLQRNAARGDCGMGSGGACEQKNCRENRCGRECGSHTLYCRQLQLLIYVAIAIGNSSLDDHLLGHLGTPSY